MNCLCPSPDTGFYSMVSLARAGYWLMVQHITLSGSIKHGSRGEKPQHHHSFGNHLQSQQLIIAGEFAKLSRDHNFLLLLI